MERIQKLLIKLKNFFEIIYKKDNYFSSNDSVDQFYNDMVSSGPLYIKFCQLLAQKTSILNDNNYLKTKLSTLQDNSPFHSLEQTKIIFQKNYNCNVEDFFSYFEEIPIFSGCISQIYICKLNDEDQLLIMKIKHPNIEEEIKKNIDEFKIIVKLLKIAGFDFLNILELDIFYQQLLDQTDFIKEAQNTKMVYEKFDLNMNVKIPKIRTFSEDIIIQDFMEGDNYNKFIIKHPSRKIECKIKAARCYLEMIFLYRFAHLDCHNGNILFKEKDNKTLEIIFIDYGLCCTLSQTDRDVFGNLIKAINYKSDKLLLTTLIKCCRETVDESNLRQLFLQQEFNKFYNLKKNDEAFVYIKELLIKLSNAGIKIKNELLNIIINLSLILESIDLEYCLDVAIFDYVIYDIIEGEDCLLKKNVNKIINVTDYLDKKKVIDNFYKNLNE